MRHGCKTVLVMLALGAVPAVAADPAPEPLAAPAAPNDAPGAAEAPLDAPDRELGYALGYRIGGRILADHKALGMPIDNAALARGLSDAVQGRAPRLPEAEFRRVIVAFDEAMQKREAEFAARMAAAARVNLEKGRTYLADNVARPGVVTLPSGLQYEVLREGTGARPGPDDTVVAHYRGTRIDGTEFDGTDPAGDPATFPLRGVVPGWQEALPRMSAGSKWRITLPPELAYGVEGSPPAIEPNEVLVFEIELIRSGPTPASP